MPSNAISPIRHNLLKTFSPSQMALIQRTYAKDLTDDEFDLFLSQAAAMQLNPLQKQIYAVVYNKTDAARRQLVIITGIDGFRSIAARTDNYRPDDELPVWEYDEAKKNPDNNPLGLVAATARVFRFAHGSWFPIPHRVEWEAYAPLIEGGSWEETGETYTYKDKKTGKESERTKREFVKNGKSKLDPTKQRWIKDGKGMLAKCAEAGALRKGWPEQFSGLAVQEEMDSAHTFDLSASEYAETDRMEQRLAMIGAKGAITFEMTPEDAGYIPAGKVADRIHEWLDKYKDDPIAVETWRERNRHGLKEFWMASKTDALEVNKRIEAILEHHKKIADEKPKSDDNGKTEGASDSKGGQASDQVEAQGC